MFTGIVEARGLIEQWDRRGDGARIKVAAGDLDVADIAIGDSVAVNGCCLTVVAIADRSLQFDVSAETMRCTAPMDVGTRVNLEKSLRFADRLGGHLVAGHVDGVGTVVEFRSIVEGSEGSWHLVVEAPADLARFIASKGSIAVQGVSLTVNEVAGARFAVNLIPHTLDATAFKDLLPGAKVNLEVDMVARYVARLAEFER